MRMKKKPYKWSAGKDWKQKKKSTKVHRSIGLFLYCTFSVCFRFSIYLHTKCFMQRKITILFVSRLLWAHKHRPNELKSWYEMKMADCIMFGAYLEILWTTRRNFLQWQRNTWQNRRCAKYSNKSNNKHEYHWWFMGEFFAYITPL